MNGIGTFLAVKPFPISCLKAIADVEHITERTQDLNSFFFNDHLSDGDLLFIDSTHAVKHDSDVLHIYLQVLPELNRSVTIHANDIYLPEPLPLNLLREHQIYWNEQYLLYAYILNNPRVKTLFVRRYHMLTHHAELTRFMRDQYQPGGTSLWFEQTRMIAVETTNQANSWQVSIVDIEEGVSSSLSL